LAQWTETLPRAIRGPAGGAGGWLDQRPTMAGSWRSSCISRA